MSNNIGFCYDKRNTPEATCRTLCANPLTWLDIWFFPRVFVLSRMTQATKDRARQAIEAVANGDTLKSALANARLTAATLNQLLSGDRELALAYARAQEIRADLLADQIIDIADDDERDPHRARNQIQARQWIASKHNSKRYGDRIDLNVTQTIDVSATLSEARSRLITIEHEPEPPLTGGLIEKPKTTIEIK